MKVDKPEFNGQEGQVTCGECPFEDESLVPCRGWWYRHGDSDVLICPTAATYAEACRLAEESNGV